MANPYHSLNRRLETEMRRSMKPYTPSHGPPETDPDTTSSPASSSRNSSIRSYSSYLNTGVTISRPPPPPSNEDIIMVVVRISSPFRRNSLDPSEDLPSRPHPRSFLKRLSTRLHGPASGDSYKAIKMPRAEYKRYFARDREGRYAGSEAERQWSEAEVVGRFGGYRDVPLWSVWGWWWGGGGGVEGVGGWGWGVEDGEWGSGKGREKEEEEGRM
ncbi:hypothetical protein LTR08_005957 [Meristemomyces frigidus]|nr:hypothetical protein LTR08_005957 [Meristemomyces frigidus]